ncbi:xyloglucan endotransglucosylase/hydrolase protein 2-like [Trifolium pratense]|uniref:Uncharacterized protein n=1 Tax=Trifolium pratense TaxID=57577 RepID=A0ACB0J0U4_TRIPR|nr:xyloglucan endotransglucosylase/hydrolase protein 2-like [Trifolium pratense]CAJ2638047.1 unnamed protein product [Trifolium pratense]
MCFSHLSFLLIFSLLAPLYVKGVDWNNVPFEKNYAILWGKDNIRIINQSREVQLTLDPQSGSGFGSLHKYGSGSFRMRIKLPQKDSTAVVSTFYLISDDGPTRDEIDFEFLGGNKKRPYLLHTNIYTNGKGSREQRIRLWFDPTADFHDYTLIWNEKQLAFFVDNTPIRVFKNTRNKGGMYPTKAMKILATIWNSTWAGNGAPVNWKDGPFEAHYREFGINACQVQTTNIEECNSSRYWWNGAKFWELNTLQKQVYKNVRRKYLIYDFCTKMPRSPEC